MNQKDGSMSFLIAGKIDGHDYSMGANHSNRLNSVGEVLK